MSARPLRVLLTGFGAFPGAPRNPSAEIVTRIGRRRGFWARLGVELTVEVLPVTYGQLSRSGSGAGFDVVLHVGLAGRRDALCVETRARNRRSILHRDAAGFWSRTLLLQAGAEASRACRVPAARLVVAMRNAGVPARRSIDAGDYVCNETLWHSLAGAAPVVGFIHVPRPGDPRRPSDRRPTIDAMTRAIAQALRVLIVEARRQQG